jgi:CubicO group peptidase (beta-lactamase class C family)
LAGRLSDQNYGVSIDSNDLSQCGKFTYSGEGYFLLQRVVEKLTDQPLHQLAQTELFEPLGVGDSSFV